MSIRWVIPYAGVPPESLFGATGGLGAPLVVNTLTGDLYTYIAGSGVTLVGGGGGGGGGGATCDDILAVEALL